MNKPVKFLIIRFSSIGDIVLTTPVIRCLKQQYPNAEVHFVVKKKFRQVVEHNPYIDHLHLLDNNLEDLVKIFKTEHFDYIIDLHKTLRSYLLRLRLRRPTLTFRKLSVQKLIMNRFHVDFLPKGVHIVERNLRAVEPLGVKNDHHPVDYFISPEDEVPVSSLPPSHQNGYIAFVIGGQHFTKKLPPEKIIAICKRINKPIVLLGGPEDAAVAELITASGSENIVDACGKYSLNQSVSLLKSASSVIAHDTGLMHIAGAFNKPIVSVWGATSASHFGVWPYLNTQQVIAEVKGLPCHPCSNFGMAACPQKHFKCMWEQDENLIADSAVKMFNETSFDK
ncbi:glycosyltransferase family 9 protein [Dyadobacter sp. LJ53]|uniref:glycosyltransferase family 9 protein n=1 Tax=Dyadobacter chenwenxiniae TaxID=2906456 RepID=UPI001F1ACAB8|nr:glycosyltransferase family 9 protein [Dyadobacter chenwenxiniae]MCF0052191.1 glycosyltransferase family 9 protein [Dyadobacter chenwenxiniae]